MAKLKKTSWYSETANMLLPSLGRLRGEETCDICIVGGGFTGLSAALELSQKGYSVILLEAKSIPTVTSSKIGGHILRGYSAPISFIERKFGAEHAKKLIGLSLEGVGLILERIKQHNINCNLKFGTLTVSRSAKEIETLKRSVQKWQTLGHTDLKVVDRKGVKDYMQGKGYAGGVFDPKGAHFHPLNYALALAQEAQVHGCKIFDDSKVLDIQKGETVTVLTESGQAKAKFVILAGYVDTKGTEVLKEKSVTTHATLSATFPLEPIEVQETLPKPVTIIDTQRNHFYLSGDNRIIFGGNQVYDKMLISSQAEVLKEKIRQIFPSLEKTQLEHCWGTSINATRNHLPHVGRLDKNIFFAHGYEWHETSLSNLMGKLIAEAVSGTAERFDIFANIKHSGYIGGEFTKKTIFQLDKMWNRIKYGL